MLIQDCSDGVESRAEQAILDAEMWGRAASPSDSEHPDGFTLGDTGLKKRLDPASRPPL